MTGTGSTEGKSKSDHRRKNCTPDTSGTTRYCHVIMFGRRKSLTGTTMRIIAAAKITFSRSTNLWHMYAIKVPNRIMKKKPLQQKPPCIKPEE